MIKGEGSVISEELAMLVKVVNSLSIKELSDAVEKSGYDIFEVLDIIDKYTPEELK